MLTARLFPSLASFFAIWFAPKAQSRAGPPRIGFIYAQTLFHPLEHQTVVVVLVVAYRIAFAVHAALQRADARLAGLPRTFIIVVPPFRKAR